jgi:hypothetical protein
MKNKGMTIDDIEKRLLEIRVAFAGTSNAVQARIDELNLLKRFITELDTPESKYVLERTRFI